jgi:hypothetical protein
MDGPFLTVKLDGWWALERVGDCVDVDIEKMTDWPEYCCPVLGCFTVEMIWLVAQSERDHG